MRTGTILLGMLVLALPRPSCASTRLLTRVTVPFID